jgi:hypothetical protein
MSVSPNTQRGQHRFTFSHLGHLCILHLKYKVILRRYRVSIIHFIGFSHSATVPVLGKVDACRRTDCLAESGTAEGLVL